MKITVISHTGFSLGIVPRLTREGHSVASALGTGEVVGDMLATPPDIALFDSPIFSALAEATRNRGVKVIGPSPWSRLLTSDREYEKSLISAIGYKQAEGKEGVHVTVSCWFNGQKFISRSLVFNYSKMMAGDVGATVDCSGYIAYFNVSKSKLVEDILQPLEKFLRKANHRGCFSVDCVCNADGVFVSNISSDFTKPYAQALFENTNKNKSEILLGVFNETSQPIYTISPVVCGIMLSVYPYPYTSSPVPCSIAGLNSGNLKHIWQIDMSGNNSGCFGYVTARGDSSFEAKRRAYRTIENLSVDGLQYRNDIGKDIPGKLRELVKLGLVPTMEEDYYNETRRKHE